MSMLVAQPDNALPYDLRHPEIWLNVALQYSKPEPSVLRLVYELCCAVGEGPE